MSFHQQQQEKQEGNLSVPSGNNGVDLSNMPSSEGAISDSRSPSLNNNNNNDKYFRDENHHRVLWMGDVDEDMNEDFLRKAFAHFNEKIVYSRIIRNRVVTNDGRTFGYAFIGFEDEATAQRVLSSLSGKQIPNAKEGKLFKLNPSGRSPMHGRQQQQYFRGSPSNQMGNQSVFMPFQSANYSSSRKESSPFPARASSGLSSQGNSRPSSRSMSGLSSQTNPGSTQQNSNTTGHEGSQFTVYVGDLDVDITDDFFNETFTNNFKSVFYAKIIRLPQTGESKGFGFVRFTDEAEYNSCLSQQSRIQALLGCTVKISVAHPKPSFGRSYFPSRTRDNSVSSGNHGVTSSGFRGSSPNQGSRVNRRASGQYPNNFNGQQFVVDQHRKSTGILIPGMMPNNMSSQYTSLQSFSHLNSKQFMEQQQRGVIESLQKMHIMQAQPVNPENSGHSDSPQNEQVSQVNSSGQVVQPEGQQQMMHGNYAGNYYYYPPAEYYAPSIPGYPALYPSGIEGVSQGYWPPFGQWTGQEAQMYPAMPAPISIPVAVPAVVPSPEVTGSGDVSSVPSRQQLEYLQANSFVLSNQQKNWESSQNMAQSMTPKTEVVSHADHSLSQNQQRANYQRTQHLSQNQPRN